MLNQNDSRGSGDSSQRLPSILRYSSSFVAQSESAQPDRIRSVSFNTNSDTDKPWPVAVQCQQPSPIYLTPDHTTCFYSKHPKKIKMSSSSPSEDLVTPSPVIPAWKILQEMPPTLPVSKHSSHPMPSTTSVNRIPMVDSCSLPSISSPVSNDKEDEETKSNANVPTSKTLSSIEPRRTGIMSLQFDTIDDFSLGSDKVYKVINSEHTQPPHFRFNSKASTVDKDQYLDISHSRTSF